MKRPIFHKRGANFYYHLNLGFPLDGCTVDVQSYWREGSTDFSVRILPPSSVGDIEITATNTQTSEWPITPTLPMDIRVTHDNGEITYSDTLYIKVLREITQP